MKKKSIILGIIIVVIIAIITVGIIISKSLISNNKIEKIEEKLSGINSNELQSKLIEELEKTSLNVNTSSISTTFGNNLIEIMNKTYSNNKAPIYYYDMMFNNNKDEEDYIFAIYFDKNNTETSLSIPCFKIESDNNGNFKNIVSPVNNGSSFAVGNNVWTAFINVLKNEYNIDVSEYSLGNGIKGLWQDKKIKVMKYEADSFSEKVSNEIISKTSNFQYHNFDKNNDYELNIQKFGIDTIKSSK